MGTSCTALIAAFTHPKKVCSMKAAALPTSPKSSSRAPKARTPASASSAALAKAKENARPLVEDIRLLGRILGDVIREQEGAAAFELVERIRKLSVAFRQHADEEADKTLKKPTAR